MPQKQNSILSYFSPRAPNSNSISGGGSSSNNKGTSGSSSSPSSNKVKTPQQKQCTTPVSSTHSKKRRPSEPLSADSNKKRPKPEDSPGKEFTEGCIVWAKLEGYPWWPAMIRAENVGAAFSRKNWTEFHVQFFDDPPSRAWIRKPDMKIYGGSTDGAVPPARTDPTWVDACKTADSALIMSPKKRVDKFWVDFEMEDMVDVKDDSEEEVKQKSPKLKLKNDSGKNKKKPRRLHIIESSDDEECNETASSAESSPEKKNGRNHDDEEYKISAATADSSSDSSIESEIEEEDEESPPKLSKGKGKNEPQKSVITTPKNSTGLTTPKNSIGLTSRITPASSRADFKSRLSQFTSSDSSNVNVTPKQNGNVEAVEERTEQWPHLKLEWLKPSKIKDANGKRPNDPDYNSRTLHVPEQYLAGLTPGLRQWWVLKAQNFDTVLFFKVGKFYEFYHMDAVVASQELGILFMKGDYAHSGFPEQGYSKFSSTLVQKGYKVARIEQTETPDMMNERCKKIRATKFDKVVKREICQIATKGVRYASFQDDRASNPFTPESLYLIAVVERIAVSGPAEYGVCFIDTTIGKFHIGQFKDDRYCSRLRTLFSHYTPVQILHEKNKISPTIQQLFTNLSGVRKDQLIRETEFWGAQKTLKFLAQANYFGDSTNTNIWPENLQSILSKNDSLGLTPEDGWELGVKCFGAIVWYLQHCLLDNDLLSLKDFELYRPVDSIDAPSRPNLPNQCRSPKFLILDEITLRNLDIFEGSQSLFSKLDRCGTDFGKRLLRHWTCFPLAVPKEIHERQSAIQTLIELCNVRDKVVPLIKTLPDLERLLNKVHYLGSSHRSKVHPEGRAFFFEDNRYSKNKIADLIAIVRGFKTCVQIMDIMKESANEYTSDVVLSNLISKFPSLQEHLKYFTNVFDVDSALKKGKIIPKDGVDQEYDASSMSVASIVDEANAYLKEVQKQLSCSRVIYIGSDKKRFQLEVPDNIRVPMEFEMTSTRKGFKRYYSNKTKEFLSRILLAENSRSEILRDITRRIFAQFDLHRESWSQAVQCMGNLDVLMSLALFSISQEHMCRPTVMHSFKPFINVVDGRHPCLPTDGYIPNNSKLGSSGEDTEEKSWAAFVLLTGPNMGGKSTFMRQVGLITILSHMGCYVPAATCEMSVVDRIFTRLGANDNIGEGESTFFVEMSETASILKHSSKDSLVLMDELGRGTATYDGTAIAFAVSRALSSLGCRCVFSTHYHALVETVQDLPSVQLGHMACTVKNENEDDPTQETITFLYKMVSGACPKSYGFNAAKLAGIPDEVIRVAHRKAKELETVVSKVDLFRNICSKLQNNTLSLKELKGLNTSAVSSLL